MYKITYQDNTVFVGSQPQNSKWNLINKPIFKIEYPLLKITLQGFEMYNHLIELPTIIRVGQFVSKIILMGRKNNDVLKIIYDSIKGKIYSESAIFGKEYQGCMSTGWKMGVPNQSAKAIKHAL